MILDEHIKRYDDRAKSIRRAVIDKEESQEVVELLRELKESRMVLDILGQFLVDLDLDVCCEDLTMTDNYCEEWCEKQKPLCWYRWAKMKAREVNADDSN